MWGRLETVGNLRPIVNRPAWVEADTNEEAESKAIARARELLSRTRRRAV